VAKVRYVRAADHLDDSDDVIRGGRLEADLIRVDALRMHDIYGVYGISVFSTRHASLGELAQDSPLIRFAELTLIGVRSLRGACLRLEPTGRNRRHYTIMFDDLDTDIVRLVSMKHDTWRNPYHEM
jgi:hypothetical protein